MDTVHLSLTLDSQSMHAVQQLTHSLLGSLEPQYATLLALNMLAQGTERAESCGTGRERTMVYSFCVLWTREVAVEGVKRPKSPMAEHTLVCIDKTVPRPFCGDILSGTTTVG